MKPTNHLLPGLVLALAVVLAAACDRAPLYSHYAHTPLTGWEKNDTLVFDVGPLRQSGTFREEIGLRTAETYPFLGLCLIVEQTRYPQGDRRSDTLYCTLASDDGQARGQGVSLHASTFHLTTQPLNEGDSLHISIRHNMKREILPGIADVGVTFRQSAP